jgi:hypothetical protein
VQLITLELVYIGNNLLTVPLEEEVTVPLQLKGNLAAEEVPLSVVVVAEEAKMLLLPLPSPATLPLPLPTQTRPPTPLLQAPPQMEEKDTKEANRELLKRDQVMLSVEKEEAVKAEKINPFL